MMTLSIDLNRRRSAHIIPSLCVDGDASPNRVDDHRAVDAMTILRLLAEERRRIVVGAHGHEAIVPAKAPATMRRVPFQPATHIARQERLRIGDAEFRAVVHRQPTHPSRYVWHDRVM